MARVVVLFSSLAFRVLLGLALQSRRCGYRIRYDWAAEPGAWNRVSEVIANVGDIPAKHLIAVES